MYYVDETKLDGAYVVDTSDCVREYVTFKDLESLGYPNNPVFIKKSALKQFGTKFDKPALRKIISEMRAPYYDVDLFQRISIPSLSATFNQFKIGSILKSFNYFETNGFILLAIGVDYKTRCLMLLKTNGETYEVKILSDGSIISSEYPCASGMFFSNNYGINLRPSGVYLQLISQRGRMFIDVLSKDMPLCLGD